MSLLELVMALTVFSLIMTGLAATVATGLNLTRNNRNRSVAANLASQEMDLVRSANFTSLAATVSTQSVGGVAYTVNRELTWVSKSATSGPCDGSSGSPQVLRVHVWVDWPDRAGVPPAEADTVLTPPVGTYDPNSGHIAVKVLDRDADDLYGVTVSVTGPQSRSAPTNSDGCAFFAFLPAGAYTVSLNTTNYVDRQGYQNPSQTANVTVGQISSLQFDYDQRAKLKVYLDGAYGGSYPSDVPITIGNTILLPSGTRTYSGAGSPRTISNLFPAADGYDVWSGSCADADPEGHDAAGNAYYPGASRDDPWVTSPNVTTTGTLTLTPLRVHVIDSSTGLPVANRSIVTVHVADNVCAGGETHTLGTTDSNGDLDIEMPFGTWQIQEQGHSPATSWPSVTLSPLDELPRADLTVAGVG